MNISIDQDALLADLRSVCDAYRTVALDNDDACKDAERQTREVFGYNAVSDSLCGALDFRTRESWDDAADLCSGFADAIEENGFQLWCANAIKPVKDGDGMIPAGGFILDGGVDGRNSQFAYLCATWILKYGDDGIDNRMMASLLLQNRNAEALRVMYPLSDFWDADGKTAADSLDVDFFTQALESVGSFDDLESEIPNSMDSASDMPADGDDAEGTHLLTLADLTPLRFATDQYLLDTDRALVRLDTLTKAIGDAQGTGDGSDSSTALVTYNDLRVVCGLIGTYAADALVHGAESGDADALDAVRAVLEYCKLCVEKTESIIPLPALFIQRQLDIVSENAQYTPDVEKVGAIRNAFFNMASVMVSRVPVSSRCRELALALAMQDIDGYARIGQDVLAIEKDKREEAVGDGVMERSAK